MARGTSVLQFRVNEVWKVLEIGIHRQTSPPVNNRLGVIFFIDNKYEPSNCCSQSCKHPVADDTKKAPVEIEAMLLRSFHSGQS